MIVAEWLSPPQAASEFGAMRLGRIILIGGTKVLLVVALSTLALIAGFEGYLRWTGFLEAQPANYPCVQGDTELNHLFQENCEGVAAASALKTEKDVVYKTNSRGLRGPEPRPGMRHVVLIGDSYTEGFGLGEDETLSARIQEEWNRRGVKGVQVLNGGTLGFSTVVYSRYFKRKFAELKPEFVLLNVDLTDLTDDAYYLQIAEYGEDGRPKAFSTRETFPSWLLPYVYSNKSAVIRFLHQEWNQWNLFRLEQFNRPRMDAFASDAAKIVDPEWLREAGLESCQKPLAVMAQSVLDLKKEVERNGGRFAVHMYPPGTHVKKYEAPVQNISFVRKWLDARRTDYSWNCVSDQRLVEFIRRFSEANGIPFFESFSSVIAHPDRSKLYFDRDAHWNAAGVKFVASGLADALWKAVDRK